jgi:hypothetical protein
MMPWIAKLESKPELTGPMSLALRLRGPAASPVVSGEIDFAGVDVVVGVIPGVRLDDLHGHVSISEAGTVTVRGVAAKVPIPDAIVAIPDHAESVPGGTGLRPAILLALVEGSFSPASDAQPKPTKERVSITGCSLRGVEITPGVMALLPFGPELRASLDRLAPTGSIDLMVGSFEWDGSDARLKK